MPQTGQNLQLARCSWKLLSAVQAVSVDNGMHICNVSDMDISFILIPLNCECVLCFAESHTAENIATLLKECSEVRYQMGTRLDSITTDNGQFQSSSSATAG